MTSVTLVPLWVEALVSALLVFSGLLALTGALGLLRLKSFFERMHPVALGSTLGTWCACAASMAYFSALHSRPVIHAWLIPILLCITVPITTILLARAALFRRRAAAAEDVPPPLSESATGSRTVGERGIVAADVGADLP
jgi:multicomponent K+:H+ antiporter subunit G